MKYYLLTILILYFLFMFRLTYTLDTSNKASNIISKYTNYLIDNRKYNSEINYQEEMKIEFYKYAFSFWKWNVYDFFKPEYVELIKSFEGHHRKQVIDVIYNDFAD